MTHSCKRYLASLLVPVALLALSTPGFSQDQEAGGRSRIVGHLFNAETNEPISEATLTLEPVGRTTLTNEEGRFQIQNLHPGEYTLWMEHVAYGEQSIDVDVPVDRTVKLTIPLAPEAIEVEPVEVQVERTTRPRYLENRGFYRRMERGWGNFFPPEFFEKSHVISAGQVLQRVPGVRIVGGTLNEGRIKIRANPGCREVLLYVEGFRAGRISTVRDIHEYVGSGSIGAMEVYRRPGETAPEFIDSGSRCGVIVVWTKHWLEERSAGGASRP